MYKVSILVPIFKAEKYIEKCARSLFEQTYQNLEFIFVDDCTPDASIDILLEVLTGYPNREKQAKIIYNEHNQGAAATKNVAIDNASGEFISFVDADDWMEPNAIGIMVQKQIETGVDIVWGRMMVHHDGRFLEVVEPEFKDKKDWLMNYIKEDSGGTLLSNSRRIIRRKLIDNHNIKMADGYNYSEDRLFMTQVAYYANGFNMVENVVYHYNKDNTESMTSAKRDVERPSEAFNDVISNYQLIEDFFADKERLYYTGAVTAKLKLLEKSMNFALQRSSKESFCAAVKWVRKSDPGFLYLIGWDKSKLWRWLHGNYYYRKCLPVLKMLSPF